MVPGRQPARRREQSRADPWSGTASEASCSARSRPPAPFQPGPVLTIWLRSWGIPNKSSELCRSKIWCPQKDGRLNHQTVGNGEVFVLEVSTFPGISSLKPVPKFPPACPRQRTRSDLHKGDSADFSRFCQLNIAKVSPQAGDTTIKCTSSARNMSRKRSIPWRRTWRCRSAWTRAPVFAFRDQRTVDLRLAFRVKRIRVAQMLV